MFLSRIEYDIKVGSFYSHCNDSIDSTTGGWHQVQAGDQTLTDLYPWPTSPPPRRSFYPLADWPCLLPSCHTLSVNGQYFCLASIRRTTNRTPYKRSYAPWVIQSIIHYLVDTHTYASLTGWCLFSLRREWCSYLTPFSVFWIFWHILASVTSDDWLPWSFKLSVLSQMIGSGAIKTMQWVLFRLEWGHFFCLVDWLTTAATLSLFIMTLAWLSTCSVWMLSILVNEHNISWVWEDNPALNTYFSVWLGTSLNRLESFVNVV